eukprot:9402261-Pyramimonas_sp.AAC.1
MGRGAAAIHRNRWRTLRWWASSWRRAPPASGPQRPPDGLHPEGRGGVRLVLWPVACAVIYPTAGPQEHG